MNQFCTFYIVRHGETEWNAKGLLQGQLGTDLNKNGENQAKSLAKEFKNIHFDAVFSSDLLRAKRTAEIVSFEKKLAVVTTKLLRERNFGPFEGKHYASLREYDTIFNQLTEKEKKVHKAHPDIENDEQLVKRFILFLRETAVGHEGKNILIVTHAGILRAFLIHAGYETYDSLSFDKAIITNTAYIVCKSDGVDFKVVKTVGIDKAIA